MDDPWIGRIGVWQTSPNPPCDRCDLTFVKSEGQVLVALVVDGAPGRASARPSWPRETLFEAVGQAFLGHAVPEELLRVIGDRLRAAFNGQTWRLSAAAAAIRWNAHSGILDVAEVGDTKAWIVGGPASRPLMDGGIPQKGIAPRNMLGSLEPEIRLKQINWTSIGSAGRPTLALLTDGAYSLLRAPSNTLPSDARSWAIDRTGSDDATVLLIDPPA